MMGTLRGEVAILFVPMGAKHVNRELSGIEPLRKSSIWPKDYQLHLYSEQKHNLEDFSKITTVFGKSRKL